MRKAKFFMILGYNGTGKTSFLKKLSGKTRTLIITPDFAEWTEVKEIKISEISKFKGRARMIYDKDLLSDILNYYNNGLLILDDYKGFNITSNSAEAGILRTLVIRRRQKMIDIAISGHGFTEIVPRFLFTFASHLVLFKTIDNIDRVKNFISRYDFLVKKQAEINKKSKADELKDFMTYHEIIEL